MEVAEVRLIRVLWYASISTSSSERSRFGEPRGSVSCSSPLDVCADLERWIPDRFWTCCDLERFIVGILGTCWDLERRSGVYSASAREDGDTGAIFSDLVKASQQGTKPGFERNLLKESSAE